MSTNFNTMLNREWNTVIDLLQSYRLDFRRSLESGLPFSQTAADNRARLTINPTAEQQKKIGIKHLFTACSLLFRWLGIQSFVGIIVYKTKTIQKTINFFIFFSESVLFLLKMIYQTAFDKFKVCKHLPSHLDCRLKTKHRPTFSA